MDADPKFDALVGRDPSVALDHRPLDFNGAVHCVDDTPELDNGAVAGALDDPAVVHGDGRIDQVAAERPQPRQNPVLVGSGKPRIADHVGHQDRGQFSGLAHGATPPRPCQPFRVVRAKPLGGIAKTREECRSLAWAWPHFHAALRRTWKQGAQPCVSTGRSIHAVPSITPSPREGIEDGPRLRLPRAPRSSPRIGQNRRDGIACLLSREGGLARCARRRRRRSTWSWRRDLRPPSPAKPRQHHCPG